jgi:hypothetical protein
MLLLLLRPPPALPLGGGLLVLERLIKRGLLLEHCCCGRPRRSKLHRRPRSRLCAAVRLRPSIHAPYLSALNLMTCVCSGLPAARLRRNLVAACSFTFACPHPVDCGRLSAVEAHGPCGPPNLLLHLPKDTLEDLGGRGMKVRRHIQRFPENWARSKGQTGLAPAARRLTAALRQLIHGARTTCSPNRAAPTLLLLHDPTITSCTCALRRGKPPSTAQSHAALVRRHL